MVLRNNRSGCQQSIKPYFHRRKKNRSGFWNPATTKMEFYVTKILDWLLKRNQRIYRHTCHSKKLLILLGHLKTFNLEASRTTAGSHKQKLCTRVAEVFGNHKIRPAKVQCVASPWKKPLRHQMFSWVLLQDFIGKNVWGNYLRDSRRP